MIELHLDVVDRSHDGIAELAAKILERSPALHQKGLTADYDGKRRIPEIARLNYSLKGTTLAPKSEKALDVLAEGLMSEKSGRRDLN